MKRKKKLIYTVISFPCLSPYSGHPLQDIPDRIVCPRLHLSMAVASPVHCTPLIVRLYIHRRGVAGECGRGVSQTDSSMGAREGGNRPAGGPLRLLRGAREGWTRGAAQNLKMLQNTIGTKYKIQHYWCKIWGMCHPIRTSY